MPAVAVPAPIPPLPLHAHLHAALAHAHGWLPFDRFMALALYAPGLGYYTRGSQQFGAMPVSGSDFVTAPELSPLFGHALARQVAQALAAAQADEVFEFGAGTGALAAQVLEALDALGQPLRRYSIIDLSGTLRQRQAERLVSWGARVQWLDALPDALHGVVLGNEVLDAMPVQLLHWDGTAWCERGVVWAGERWAWADRPTALRPPLEGDFAAGYQTEVHAQAEAFIRTLGERLARGAMFFIDYGFPEHEYYHAQRSGGTLMCHRAHRADADPLQDVGEKDITAHVNFTGIALAAQDVGLDVLGYTTQAHFLVNCGLPDMLRGADARVLAPAQKLMAEHEMGELFKVLALGKGLGPDFEPLGFTVGDRTHRL